MKQTCLAALFFLVLTQNVNAQTQTFTLQFLPTQNAPPQAQALLTIQVNSSQTLAKLVLTGLYPDTVYTLWTVFNILQCAACGEGSEVPSLPAAGRAGFPLQGNGVTPTAPLGAGFTSGMGLDPGLNVVTDSSGNGSAVVHLDFDLVWNAPVSNRDIILQCAPGLATGLDAVTGKPICPVGSKIVRLTSTWLRRFIGEFPLDQRAAACANYDARFDQDSPLYDITVAKGTNAAMWQCVDPTSSLPLVPFFTFDHFRLANHPDDLTHGFIGGDATDHWIDMVGRRCDLSPLPPDQLPCPN